jgi:integrase
MGRVSKRPWTYKGIKKETWVYRFMDRGRRRQKSFNRKKDADAYRIRKESEIAQGKFTTSTTKFGEAAEQFIRFQELRLRDGLIGRAHYLGLKSKVDSYIKPYFAKMQFDEIQSKHIEQWSKDIGEKGLKPATIIHIRACLRQLERYAKRRGYISTAVIADTLREHGTPRVAPIRTFAVGEVVRIFEAAAVRDSSLSPRAQSLAECFVHLAAFCGLRFGEIAALTHDHLSDLNQQLIHVRASVTQFGEFKSPKSIAGIRDVLVPMHLVEMLRSYMAAYGTPNPRGLVFLDTRDRGRVDNGTVRRSWARILYLAGIIGKEFGPASADTMSTVVRKLCMGELPHFHALRHFSASDKIARGMPLPDVASQLGHAKFDMTLQVYAHPIMLPARGLEVVEMMAAELLPGKKTQQQ